MFKYIGRPRADLEYLIEYAFQAIINLATLVGLVDSISIIFYLTSAFDNNIYRTLSFYILELVDNSYYSTIVDSIILALASI